MGGGMGGAGHLPVRPLQGAARGLLDRHATADGERGPARRPRVLVHPHRHHRPLPADARPRGVLPDGLGRQRPADRAPGAELLRRPLRPVAALRPDVRAAGREAQAAGADLARQLRRALRTADGRGRGRLRAALPAARALGRLDAAVRDDRRDLSYRGPAGVPARAGPWRGLPGRGTHALGRHVPYGRGPGRAGRPRAGQRLPPAGVPPARRLGPRDRHDAARAAGRLRGPGRPPR